MRVWLAFFVYVSVFTGVAEANDGEFYGAGATVYPIQNHVISMDAETLVIEQMGPLRGGYVDHWAVHVRYQFVNTSDQPVTVQMGFPEHCQRTVDDMEREAPWCGRPAIKGFQAKVGGAQVAVTIKVPKAGEPGALKDTIFDRVHTFEVAFKPGERVVVEHQYTHGGRIVSPMHSGLDYILRTGGLWKGPIRDFYLSIVLKDEWARITDENEVGKRLPKPTFQGWQAGTYQMRWRLKDFTPTADVNYLLESPAAFEAADALVALMAEVADGPLILKKMSSTELQQMRNLPFALLGYTFKNAALRAHFSKTGWYRPRRDFDPKWLSEAELAFVKAIKAEERRRSKL